MRMGLWDASCQPEPLPRKRCGPTRALLCLQTALLCRGGPTQQVLTHDCSSAGRVQHSAAKRDGLRVSPVLLVRLRTTCVSVTVTRARPALTRSARGRLGGGCVRWGRARARTAPGTLCRRSGDFPLGGRGAHEELASSVRGLASRSSEHPTSPTLPRRQLIWAGGQETLSRRANSARRPVSLSVGVRSRCTDREAARPAP